MNGRVQLNGFVEIGQDAAAVVEVDQLGVAGVYTGSIQTCLVLIFLCDRGYVVVHDSGQLVLSDITDLVSRYGHCQQMVVVHPAGASRNDAERCLQIEKALGVREEDLRYLPCSLPVYAVAYDDDGCLHVMESGAAAGYTPLPDKPVRASITELNNAFSELGAAKLRLDVQFSEGKYNAPRGLDKTQGEILELVLVQQKFFYHNAAFLYSAHKLGVFEAPPELIQLVESKGLERFRTEEVPPEMAAAQAEDFKWYAASQQKAD